jgi:hypothetical protein
MTVYTLSIQASHIATLSVGHQLTYDDTELPFHTSRHAAYIPLHNDVNGHQAYLGAIAHNLSQVKTLESVYTHLVQQDHNIYPACAWAQQNNSDWGVLVLPMPTKSLYDAIREAQAVNVGASELLAIQAWQQYLAFLQDWDKGGETLLPPMRSEAFYLQNNHLHLPYWDMQMVLDEQAFAWEVQHSAYLWYQLLCQRRALPRSIMASERWHPHHYHGHLGTMSIGIRLLVWHSLMGHSEAHHDGHQHLMFLQRALQIWETYLQGTTDRITHSDALQAFWDVCREWGIHLDDVQQGIIVDDLRLRLQSKLSDDAMQALRERMQAYEQENTPSQKKTKPLPDSIWTTMNHSDISQHIERIINALSAHDDSDARYFLRLLLAQDEISDAHIFQEFITFLDMMPVYAQSEKHLVSAFERLDRLRQHEHIQAKKGLMQRLAQATQTLIQQAIERLQQANQQKTWQAIQQAHVSSRVLQYQGGYRSLIDTMRVYDVDLPAWQIIDDALRTYEELRALFLQLMQLGTTQTLQKQTATGQTTTSSEQAQKTLEFLQKALDMGIDMSEIMQDSEHLRQQWRQLVDDAMNTLKDSSTIKQDISHLNTQMEQNISRLGKQLDELKTQVDNPSDDLHEKINALYGELRHLQEQANEQESTLGMTNEKIARNARLLDDVRERFSALSDEVTRTQQHASGVLKAYLTWFSKQNDAQNTDEALDKIDELVYAMRQCPAMAYDNNLHQDWLKHFDAQTTRYQILHEAKAKRLRGRRLRKFKQESDDQQTRFDICRKEAQDKLDGFQLIHATSES